MKSLYRIEQACVVDQLDDPKVCRNAAFKLDSPLKIDPSDLLELVDGQWFLTSSNIRVPLPGRWVTKH